MEGTVQDISAVVSVTSVDLRPTDIGATGPVRGERWNMADVFGNESRKERVYQELAKEGIGRNSIRAHSHCTVTVDMELLEKLLVEDSCVVQRN